LPVPYISGRAGCPPHKNHPLIQQYDFLNAEILGGFLCVG
jgi:hypothetical protein